MCFARRDYCWGWFVPKTKKVTRYCNRVTDGFYRPGRDHGSGSDLIALLAVLICLTCTGCTSAFSNAEAYFNNTKSILNDLLPGKGSASSEGQQTAEPLAAPAAVANSWDVALAEAVGKHLGAEAPRWRWMCC